MQELTQDVAADSYVAFQTREVTVQLLDNTGTLFGDGYSVSYYRAGEAEEVFGSTASGQVSKELLAWPFVEPMQMLPGVYDFQMDKKGCVTYEVRPGQTLNLQTGNYTTP